MKSKKLSKQSRLFVVLGIILAFGCLLAHAIYLGPVAVFTLLSLTLLTLGLGVVIKAATLLDRRQMRREREIKRYTHKS